MKSFAIAFTSLFAGSASAFVQNAATEHSVSLSAMPKRMWDSMVDKTQRSKSVPFLPRPVNLDGSMAGDVGFDPMYLSSIPKDWSGFIQPPSWEKKPAISQIYWMRESELKHGRIAMLAFLGYIVADLGIRFPAAGNIYSVENVPSSFAAHDILVSQGSMGFMLLAVSLLEFTSGAVLVQVSKGESDREAGDFGFDPLGFLKGKNAADVKAMKLREITHCRAAMLAFAGIATQSALSDATHSFPYY